MGNVLRNRRCRLHLRRSEASDARQPLAVEFRAVKFAVMCRGGDRFRHLQVFAPTGILRHDIARCAVLCSNPRNDSFIPVWLCSRDSCAATKCQLVTCG